MITAKELQALNVAKHMQNEQRVSDALDKALKGVTLNYNQRTVSGLYVPGLKPTDRPYVESMMRDAGYDQVSFVAQNDGRNGTDVHISFVLPPQAE
ncbi:hypothetical protein KNV09_gp184 [Vibrio phage Athena]|uniref:Uncharacterized protein n=2 Tax=Thalassavirus TaxID=2948922 RepID=A0A6M9Z2M4_9CAUD|nr:hypothetical protein KNV07_gp184 [Vibrio phage Cody]YP_010108726.1 hypothetical protein KNV09_gp184 [Vibrio phage Athena]QKN85152.1 hypothetical protein CODY_121 [Vibrio phage Cody]QKN85745.1 hypothetical protein ATHENA_122 [Vibrio phage Athena]